MCATHSTAPLATKPLAINRRARHDYTVIDTIVCGIELLGSEVKSIRSGGLNFVDSYAQIKEGQMYIMNMHIPAYRFTAHFSAPDPVRPRRLLAHTREIARLYRKVREKNITLIPLDFHTRGGLIKVTIGLCRGKQQHDKRDDIKRRDTAREVQREIKRA